MLFKLKFFLIPSINNSKLLLLSKPIWLIQLLTWIHLQRRYTWCKLFFVTIGSSVLTSELNCSCFCCWCYDSASESSLTFLINLANSIQIAFMSSDVDTNSGSFTNKNLWLSESRASVKLNVFWSGAFSFLWNIFFLPSSINAVTFLFLM